MSDVGFGIFQFLLELAGIHQFAAYLESLDQTVRDALPFVGAAVCIFGILQCFLGYKLFKFWCGVLGLFIGIVIGDAIATSGILSNTPGAYLLGLLIILFCALLGAFIAYRAYLVGVFLYAFVAASTIVFFLVLIMFRDSGMAALIVGIIAGIAMGVVAVIFRKLWIIIATSIHGGLYVCAGIMMIMLSTDLGLFFVLPPAFAIGGFIVQYFTTKKPAKVAAITATPVIIHTAPPPVSPEVKHEPLPANPEPPPHTAVPAEPQYVNPTPEIPTESPPVTPQETPQEIPPASTP